MLNKNVRALAGQSFLIVISLLATSCGGGESTTNVGTAEESFSSAKLQYDKGNYLRSSEEFQKVVFNFPGAKTADSAQYLLAMSYLRDKQFELAAVEFDRLISSYPSSSFAVNSQYMRGYAYYLASPGHYGLDQELLQKSLTIMDDFVADHPESELVAEAKATITTARARLANKDLNAAVHYYKIESYQAAIIYYQKVIDNYTDSDATSVALLGLARSNLKLRQYEKAEELLKAFASLYPASIYRNDAAELGAAIEREKSKSATARPTVIDSVTAPSKGHGSDQVRP